MTAKAPGVPKELFASLPEIRALGLMMFDPIWGEKEHKARGMEVLHVVSGRLDLRHRGKTWPADPGDTLLVPTAEMHLDACDPRKGIEIFYCSLAWKGERAFFRRVNNGLLCAMPKRRKAELVGMFDRLRADMRSAGPADELLARARLLEVLLFMFREAMETKPHAREAPAGSRRRRQIMEAAKQYLQERYAAHVSLADVASALGVSGYYLSHVFSEETDFTLFDYLTALRMGRARELLREGRLNVSQIAYAVGYASPNYFSKAFRKHAGCAPREFLRATDYPK